MSDILIIPDVHGRDFWRKAVASYPEADTIFLGDYHDPYPQDNISESESLENFKEIVEYAKTHGNVTLLLGNHDLHYISNFGEACRLDYPNSATIHFLLMDNLWLFRIGVVREIGDKAVVFTHAPILKPWLEQTCQHESVAKVVAELNSLLRPDPAIGLTIEKYLGFMSEYRGGYDQFGSPIWADVREVTSDNLIPSADLSIFAHSQSAEPIITTRWACLDCHKAFLLSSDLSLKQIY